MYHKKYLKYKNKYLNLKGGVLTQSQKEKVINFGLEIDIDDDSLLLSDEQLDNMIQQKFNEPPAVELRPQITRSYSTNPLSANYRPPVSEYDPYSTRQAATEYDPYSTRQAAAEYDLHTRPHTEEPHDGTFYIYTTGLNDDDRLVDMWFDILYKNILSCIPPNFTRIIVRHYDPVVLGSTKSRNHYLITKLREKQYKNQELLYTDLPIKHLKRPHVVIDMAHIFGYYPNEKNKYDAYWSGYYDGDRPSTKDQTRPLNIKSIYIGFDRRDIAACSPLITVQPNGEVRTFVDCLIDLGIADVGLTDPQSYIDEITQRLLTDCITQWKARGKAYSDFSDNILPKYDFKRSFFKSLFNFTSQDEVYDLRNYDFYNGFMKDLMK